LPLVGVTLLAAVVPAPAQTASAGHRDEVVKRITTWRTDPALKKYTEGIPGIDDVGKPTAPVAPTTLAEIYEREAKGETQPQVLRSNMAAQLRGLANQISQNRGGRTFGDLVSALRRGLTTATTNQRLPETRKALEDRFKAIASGGTTGETALTAELRQTAIAKLNDLATEVDNLKP
jgi:hypothetical protein